MEVLGQKPKNSATSQKCHISSHPLPQEPSESWVASKKDLNTAPSASVLVTTFLSHTGPLELLRKGMVTGNIKCAERGKDLGPSLGPYSAR